MPRTKRPVKKVDKVTDSDEKLKKLNKLVAEQKNKIDSHANMEQRNVEVAFKILLDSIKASYLEKTVGQLLRNLFIINLSFNDDHHHNDDDQTSRYSRLTSYHNFQLTGLFGAGYLTENSAHDSGERRNKKPLVIKKKIYSPQTPLKVHSDSVSTVKHVHAYQGVTQAEFCAQPALTALGTYIQAGDTKWLAIERPRPPSTLGRKTTRRSRSADASRMLSVSKTQNRSRSVYRTPMYNKNPMNYPAITPKVAPHTSLTVLRQPRQGEMVVSMSGSPVLVPSVYS
ncbi:hypothetical protein RR48_03419 [Papilio machaon]|uniref:Borealin C-terminal domain-containing protein n=1 Tax=Papilio machaon TaxID=76193 RepID=A0A0N0PB05_PAPMA|nr:hypothetical protein RR48_03419 [Papilio machaon]